MKVTGGKLLPITNVIQSPIILMEILKMKGCFYGRKERLQNQTFQQRMENGNIMMRQENY